MEPIGGSGTLLVPEVDVRAAQRGDSSAMGVVMRSLMPYVGRICGAIALEGGSMLTIRIELDPVGSEPGR